MEALLNGMTDVAAGENEPRHPLIHLRANPPLNTDAQTAVTAQKRWPRSGVGPLQHIDI